MLSFKSLRSELTDLHRVECTMSIKLQGRVWIYTFRVILTKGGHKEDKKVKDGNSITDIKNSIQTTDRDRCECVDIGTAFLA